jgi:TonB-linked SusC/RagA family outer membrane protein
MNLTVRNSISIYIKTALLLLVVFFTNQAHAQTKTIKGKVTIKEDGTALPGVTVSVKGTKTGALTDAKGAYNIQLTDGKNTLVFTSIGFTTQEVKVGNEEVVDVALSSDFKQLQEVVVSSYNTQRKQDYTGSASKVGASQLENRPLQSFDQALGGQAAGVTIIQPSGILNNTPVFRIRGINSITSGIYPLIIIDGVPAFTGLVGGTVGNNPLSNINPDDIESIDILKDASATAIYGSRAANGVVVITTKKGKKGGTKVNYDGTFSFSKPVNLPKLLNAQQYVTIKNEAMTNAGKTPGFALQTLADGSTVNTNWYDVAYQTGYSNNHNVSFSGATDATNYFIALGYTNQNAIIRTDSYNNKDIRINLDHKLYDNFSIGTHFTYNNSLNAGPNSGALPGQYIGTDALGRLTYILPPNVAVYNPDGSYNIQDLVRVGYGANNSNPASPGYVGTINAYNLQVLLDLDKYTSETNSAIGDVYAEWTLVKGLKAKTSYGINKLVVENLSFQNPVNGDAAPYNGIATNSNNNYYRTDWINTLSYAASFGNHNFNALGGYEEIYTTTNSWGATRSNLTDPFFTSYQGGFTTITASNNAQGVNGFKSYFSNFNYNYDRKYLLSFSYRRDGYSGLPSSNQFGNFLGGSAGWNISEEKFFKNSSISSTISSLKIRGSYGTVGNINIGDFPALGQYSAGTYAGTPTLGYTQAGNSNLKWETSKKTDIGINFGILHDKITIEADYFNNQIDGLVLNAQQAPSKGIPNGTISANVGSMYNRGFELNVNANIISESKFRWNANFNFSTLQNKVTALSNGSDIYTPSSFGIQNMTRVGYSVGSIWAVPTVGVNPNNGYRIFINKSGQQVQYNQVGTPKWTFLDGTAAPAIDNYLDGKIQGPSLPTWYGGLNNTFTYANFDLSVGITFSGGNYIYDGARANELDQRYFNNGTFVLNRWTTPGQVTDIPKLIYGDNVSTGFSITNSAMVEKGDYAKLKTLSLGYRVPVRFFNNKVNQIHVFAQATNLLTITNYRGADPEVSINGNSIASGKDQNNVVSARTISIGANVEF